MQENIITQIGDTHFAWDEQCFSYLHYIGFRHKDLFIVEKFFREDVVKFADSKVISSQVIEKLILKLTLTPERKQSILLSVKTCPFEDFVRKLSKLSIQILLHTHREFPEGLLEIHDPPFLLYVQGCLTRSNGTALRIGLVGSREATPYGEQIVAGFVPRLVQAGVTLVSGGALGIDGMVHELTLKSGGHTVVVLGSGIDVWYPRKHEGLFTRVVANGGAIVSHFPIGTGATPYTFPIRNEIIATLCQGLVVVEAKEKSGSLITAQLALELGKDVFAVPADISRQNSRGTNLLIQNSSAKLVLSPDDILSEYGMNLEAGYAKLVSSKNRILAENPLQQSIMEFLDSGAKSPDVIADSLGHTISEIQGELGKMEIFGTITRNSVGQYFL